MMNWKKIVTGTFWGLLGTALVALAVISWKAKVGKKYTQIQVELIGETKAALFMDEKDIVEVLKLQGVKEGVPAENINLEEVEKNLEKIRWINNAELFSNNQQLLEVKIEQRIPIARLFTVSGSSFYIDKYGSKLPLKQLTVLRLPVFTGFPSDQEILSKPDSVLLQEIVTFSNIIRSDSFFTAQVGQINIEPNGEYYMIPTLGDHVVILGSIENIEAKLNRLYTFYKKVWTQSGINAYQVLDCRFDKQIVALKKGMQPIQYAPGALPMYLTPLRNDSVATNLVIVDSLKKINTPAVPNSPLKKMAKGIDNPLKILGLNKVADTVKSLKNKISSPKKKPAISNKIERKKSNKQDNKSLIKKNKTAKALLPAKTTPNNN